MNITARTIKRLIFLIVVFSVIINLANLIYTKKYFKEYSSYNSEIISNFNNYQYNPENKITENDFQALCLKLKPDSFLPTYNKLVIGSLFSVIILLAVFLIAFKKQILSLRYKYSITAILIVLFIIWLYVFILEADYDFIGCSKFL